MADIFKGNTSLSKIYRGQTELSKVYRGQTEIWTSAPPGPSVPIPTTNLVMFWDGTTYSGTGDWIDSYGGYDLAPQGNVSYDTGNQAWDFPGADTDYMISSQNNPILGSQNRTIIVYALHDTASPQDNTYFSIGFPGYPSVNYEKFTFRVDGSGISKLRTEIDGGYSRASSLNDVPVGEWVMGVTQLDGTTLADVKFALAYSTSTTVSLVAGSPNNTSTIDTANNYIVAGINNYNTAASKHPMEGLIKFIAVYDAALSQSTIQDIYDTLSAL